MSILHYNDQFNQPEATDWIGQLHKQLRGWIEAWQPIQLILGNLGWSLTTLFVLRYICMFRVVATCNVNDTVAVVVKRGQRFNLGMI